MVAFDNKQVGYEGNGMNRRIRCRIGSGALLVLCAAATSAPMAFAAGPLRSPWDGRLVAATDTAYACETLPYIAPDLVTDGFYRLDDPTHSVIDPVRQAAYNKSSGVVKSVGLAVIAAADAYRTTGSRQAAQCAIKRIVTLAHDKALTGKMSSSQAYYVQGWVTGAVAIAYLKVRDSGDATPEQDQTIAKWLLSVGEQSKAYYDKKRNPNGEDKQNNHLYWAGVEIAAIGIAANNRSDFDWGMATYDNGVNQIRPDGTLPLEMARGSKALHYHLYALAPLVFLAECGEANGLDMYAHANGAIHRLAAVSVAGLRDPSLFAKATGIKQEVPTVPSGDQIGWAPPYARRFPNPELTRMIQAAPSLSVFYLGGLPPD